MKDSEATEACGENDLIALVEEAFKDAFGNEILGVANRSMLPHEAFIEVRVKRATADMNDLGQEIAKEFDELGKQLTIRIVVSASGS